MAVDWNYRLLETTREGETQVVVALVFYDDDGSLAGTDGAAVLTASNLEILKEDVQAMMEAFDRPILTDTDFRKSILESRLVQIAEKVATRAHEGQVDKAGRPYIEHPRRVAAAVAHLGAECVAAAWLHDVMEHDAAVPFTRRALLEEGVEQDVVMAVMALTRPLGTTYSSYITRIAGDPIARAVKVADLRDNLDPERMALLPEETQQSLGRRYKVALEALTL